MEDARIYPTLYYVDCPPGRSGRTRTSLPSCALVKPGEDLDTILRSRGLSEKKDGRALKPGESGMPAEGVHWFSDKLSRQKGPELKDIHTACFLSFLALSADVATPAQTVGDSGIVHDLIHEFGCRPSIRGYRGIIDLVRQIESVIPGYWA